MPYLSGNLLWNPKTIKKDGSLDVPPTYPKKAQLEPTLTSLSTALAALSLAWPLAFLGVKIEIPIVPNCNLSPPLRLQLVAGFGRLDAIGYLDLLKDGGFFKGAVKCWERSCEDYVLQLHIAKIINIYDTFMNG